MERGPIEQERVTEAFERLVAQAHLFRASALPKPFGALQAVLRNAKEHGASAEECRLAMATGGPTGGAYA